MSIRVLCANLLCSCGVLPPAFSLFPSVTKTFTFHQILVLIITFVAYASFHASHKPPSIVKSVLGPSVNESNSSPPIDNGWAPFNRNEGTQRLGKLDLAFLSSYRALVAIPMKIADNAGLDSADTAWYHSLLCFPTHGTTTRNICNSTRQIRSLEKLNKGTNRNTESKRMDGEPDRRKLGNDVSIRNFGSFPEEASQRLA
ncbi:hypothetical protein Bca101_081471 [Brassica carinata]